MFDLKETSRLMREQDNRCTQYPLFVVQEEITSITHPDYSDATEYLNEEGVELSEDELCEDCQVEADCESHELDSPCVTCGYLRTVPVKKERKISDRPGFFFTEAECEDHIALNHYHYSKPRSYVISAWRNPEMVTTMQMILQLTGDDIPSQYK